MDLFDGKNSDPDENPPELARLSLDSLPVAGVILAAGESRRMGTPKVLQLFRGKPFWQWAVQGLQMAGVKKIFLVLGHRAASLRTQLNVPDGVVVLENREYRYGQFSSLRVAIQNINPHFVGCLVCLVDQPHLPLPLYTDLVREIRQNPQQILIPAYHGRGGHPVYLPSWLFREIQAAPMKSNLREIFRRFAEKIKRVELPYPEMLEDIDTPDDLARLSSQER